MRITKIIKAKSLNPNTKEEIENIKAVTSDGFEYNVSTKLSFEEIAADPQKFKDSLILGDGQYGKYLYQRKYEVMAEC